MPGHAPHSSFYCQTSGCPTERKHSRQKKAAGTAAGESEPTNSQPARNRASQQKSEMKSDVYQVVTDRIVGLLEQGVVPWQELWRGGEMMPRNLVSKMPYRGVNVFLLDAMSYQGPFWLRFNQTKDLGGHVKKGEHACPVVFWKWLEVSAPERPTGKKTAPFLRYYSVFNVAQCEGVPAEKIPVLNVNEREHNPIAEAEQIVANMPKKPEIRLGGGRACY
jgi:antirestriction protein ArdC